MYRNIEQYTYAMVIVHFGVNYVVLRRYFHRWYASRETRADIVLHGTKMIIVSRVAKRNILYVRAHCAGINESTLSAAATGRQHTRKTPADQHGAETMTTTMRCWHSSAHKESTS